tara:strand:- start:2678 stop:3217 length:540 start_codon:yes stop_codon:yes gene_type:complete
MKIMGVDVSNLSLIDESNMATNSATRPPSQQSVKAYVNAVPLGAYSKTLIKVHPSDFRSNDDRGNAQYGVIDDGTTDSLGFKVGHSSVEAYVFVKIPSGYKATHVQVLASASTSNATLCKTFNYTTGATTDLASGTFDFNTNENITDVTASTTNDLVIHVTPASTSVIIYGATVTIVAV